MSIDVTSQPHRKYPTLRAAIRKDGLYLTDHLHIILATVTISLLSLAVPIMTLQVYDRILDNPEGGTLPILLSGVVVAIILENVIKLGRSFIVQNAGAIFEHKMNCKVFFHTLHSDFSKIPDFDPASHMQRFSAINDVKEEHSGASFVSYCETCLLPVFFLLLAYMAHWLTVVPLLIAAIYMALAWYISLQLQQAVEIRDEHDEKRYSFLVRTLAGIHSIKAFASEKFFERQYEKYKEEMGANHYRVATLNAAIANLGSVFSTIMTVTVMTCGAYLVIQQSLTTGALIATILITGRIMQPVQKIVQNLIKKREVIHSYEDLENLLSMPTDRPIDELYFDMANKQENIKEATGTLEIRDMSFQYAEQEKLLFDNVNFNLNPGDMVNITGDFGSGKTTLMKLLCGVYPPGTGQILVDDYPVNQYSQQELPSHVGLIESRGVLFRGTIRDNITRFGLTPEEPARQAAELLDLNREIAKLPAGFETMLSGKPNDVVQPDLRQRIAIARTLATQPKLLLFDEPNRDLDFDSYNVLFKTLATLKGKATIILVSSDKNLNSLCDRFYTIQGKTIISA